MILPATKCTFRLSQSEVHVWCFNTVHADPSLLGLLQATLSPSELSKAHRLLKPLHQQRAIYARGMLRVLLGRYLAQNPHDILLTQNHYGKPLHADLQFNLSHSNEWIVYAFSLQGDLGIDIEHCTWKEDFVALSKQFATDLELEAIMDANDQNRMARFYRLWTAKEAVIKALGKGFYADTRQFSVECREDQPQRMIQSNLGCAHWELHAFTPDKEYAACVTSSLNPIKIDYYCVDETCIASSTPPQCV